MPSGSLEGTAEAILFGIVHAILLKDRFEAALVKRGIVGHKRHTQRELGGDLCPYFWETKGAISICRSKSMNGSAPRGVIIGCRPDEMVYLVGELTIKDRDKPYTAYTAAFGIGGFKIYGDKVFHTVCSG